MSIETLSPRPDSPLPDAKKCHKNLNHCPRQFGQTSVPQYLQVQGPSDILSQILIEISDLLNVHYISRLICTIKCKSFLIFMIRVISSLYIMFWKLPKICLNMMRSPHKRSFRIILTDIQCWLFKGLSK